MLLAYEVQKCEELRRVRDFVGGFVEGTVSLAELMEGPPRDDDDDLEGISELDVLEELEGLDPDDLVLLQQVLGGDPRGAVFESILRAAAGMAGSAGPAKPRKAKAKGKAKRKKKGSPKRR